MNTLIVKVESAPVARENTRQDFMAAMSGKVLHEPFVYSFPDIETLTKVMLMPVRVAIINAMTGAEAMSVRELARRVERDYRAVHRDVQALLNAGVIDRDDRGQIVFPYDAVHFDFSIGTAAA